ncbi:MAG: ParA family protein [Chitinispirillaceae bacterium]|nr:ParA family protein [Chitinispirillaceae bacterium]
MRIIAVLNHKGGVGKTTFTGCTAQALALSGFRVCVIDNDSQHNLSTLLGVGARSPSIRDIYRGTDEKAPELMLRAIRKTDLPDLHIITADKYLCDADIHDIHMLKRTISACRLERFYEVIMIDNAPGLDRLQGAAISAAHEIFVPTELRQFAIDGLVEMEQTIAERYPDGGRISRIIPNFYKNTKRQRAFIAALRRMFPAKVTETSIPVDSVFDEVVTDGKILFLHRLYSTGAAYYLKIIHELFNLDEEKVWEQVMEKRTERIRSEARQRFFEQRERNRQSDEA